MMNKITKQLCVAGVAVFAFSLNAQAAITYLDADGTNTTGTNWNFRNLGNNNNVFESQSSNGNELTTTITGLTAGTEYNIFGFYWGADDAGSWRTEFGTVSGSLTAYYEATEGATVGTLASTATYTVTPLVEEGNRDMYLASLGTLTANGSGEIAVYIDDNSTSSNNTRAWYDGVGYEAVPEPSAAALFGLTGLLLVLRRRRTA